MFQKIRTFLWAAKKDELETEVRLAKNRCAAFETDRKSLLEARDIIPHKSGAYDMVTRLIVKLARELLSEEERLCYFQAKLAKHTGGVKPR